jgi:cytochrome P450
LKAIPADGTTFDLQELCFDYTMDTSTDYLLGHSVKTLVAKRTKQIPNKNQVSDQQFVSSFTEMMLEGVLNIRLGPFQILRFSPGAWFAERSTSKYIYQLVDQALAEKDNKQEKNDEKQEENAPYVFLKEVAQATDDRTTLRDEILNALLAGRDTTASLLGNLFFVLARHPDIWEKIRAEVSTLNGELPTTESINGMKYVRYCINECKFFPPPGAKNQTLKPLQALRIHPPVPINSREATSDQILPVGGGPDGKSPIFIKKGTQVYYHAWSMQRSKELYGDDAEQFRPERWETLKTGWDYVPFNRGPRHCLGSKYSCLCISLLLV